MKTLAKRHPGRQPNRGYLAPCSACGEVVVHAASTDRPFHMHYHSERCRRLAAARAARRAS